MSYRRALVAALAVLSACAEAGVSLERTDASLTSSDGNSTTDSPPGSADASTDSPPACTPMMVNLLQNPSFEGAPLATGWSETRYQNEPIVRTDGFAAQSPTTKAWLGGVTGSAASDALHQDIAVPASTTALSITGFYYVVTGETGATVYDRGTIDLVSTAGTTIEAIQAFTNAGAVGAWTAFNHPFTATVAGQTVRLKMSSTNDILNATSFYFDTLALTATVCQ